jgi:dephospho-CoA kinase
MYLIALTGGIASGKSVVAAQLASHGAVVVDADLVAREVVEPGTPVLHRIREEFGNAVITPEGTLDRVALGAAIFPDPEKRELLNGIIHPAIRARVLELFAQAEAADPNAVVVYDVPLLVESPERSRDKFDLVVVVNTSQEERLRRLVELRGLSPEEAGHRLNSQASDTERLAIADVVIDANGSLEETLEQVDSLWERVVDAQVLGVK